MSSTDQLTVDVLVNDTLGAGAQIVEVSDPEVGSVSVQGDQIVVDLPESYSGVVMFTYTVLDASGATSTCLLYTSPSPRDLSTSRMPSSA